MRSLWHRCITLTLAGFAAGWLVASLMRPGHSPAARSRITPPPSSLPKKARSAAEVDELIQAVHRAGGPGAQIRAALSLAASLAPADYEMMLGRARFLPAHAAQSIFTRAVLRRWIEFDAATAVKWCAGHEPDRLADSMRLWNDLDPAAARAFVATLPSQQRDSAIRGCAESMAAADPATALEFIARAATGNSYPLRGAFRALAERNPQWLLERVESLPAALRRTACEAVAGELGRKDFDSAVAWARQQPNQEYLLETLLRATKNQSAALTVIASLPPGLQASVLNSCASDLSNRDPDKMVELLKDTPGLSREAGERLMNSAIYRLADQDPAGLVKRLESAFADRMEWWARECARQWAGKDPAAAKAWVATLADEQIRREALEAIASREATLAVGSTRDPVERLIAKARASEYIESGALLALTAAERAALLLASGDNSDRRHLWSNIVNEMTHHFPGEYGAWLRSQPEGSDAQRQVPNFAREWAGEEPAAAAAWVRGLPEGESKDKAAGAVAGQWAALDPAAARQWVESLPAGSEREHAANAIDPPPPQPPRATDVPPF
jgi:hypothetical protein